MFFRSISFIVFFITLIHAVSLFSQMPDWTYFRDREGNKYYFDESFKIVITDKPVFRYPPYQNRESITIIIPVLIM